MTGTALATRDVILDGVVREPMPWEAWPDIEYAPVNIDEIGFRLIPKAEHGTSYGDRVSAVNLKTHETLGILNTKSLRSLSQRYEFPPEFIGKRTAETQVVILNELASEYSGSSAVYNCFREPWTVDNQRNVHDELSVVTSFSPATRDIVQPRTLAVTADSVMRSIWPGDAISIKKAVRTPSGMELSFITPMDMPISDNGRSIGDVLGFGIEISYAAATRIEVGMYLQRLVCLNGMVVPAPLHKWNDGGAISSEGQLQYVMASIANAYESFPDMVQRFRQLQAVKISGNPESVLVNRARALGLPERVNKGLMEAFSQEPGDTEAHMVNAFTYYATHLADASLRDRIQKMLGLSVQQYDNVRAFLPRSLAERIGAQIIEEVVD